MKKRTVTLKFIFAALIYSASLITAASSRKNFIFDFGGVLFFTNKLTSLRHIGLTDIALCSAQQGINPLYLNRHITKKLFDTLNQVGTLHQLKAIHSAHQTYDEHGNTLPLLMCAWLQGNISNDEIKTLIHQEINQHPEWFECNAEKRIIIKTIELIFTPELLINSRKTSKAGIAFLKKCKNEGHKIYGLSNWDAESYVLLQQKYPELFELFDGVVISGEVNANKPHENIYQALINRYDLEPKDCWFIDDQKENVAAAQKLGINAIVHNSTFHQLIKNIRLAYSRSVTRRENFKNKGIIASAIKKSKSAIIEGENISLADSTKNNCLPANV